MAQMLRDKPQMTQMAQMAVLDRGERRIHTYRSGVTPCVALQKKCRR